MIDFVNVLRLSTRARLGLLLGISCFGSSAVHAQWTGAVSGVTNDLTHSYSTNSNWTGGAFSDAFGPGPTLTAATTLFASENRTTTGPLVYNYAGAFNLNIEGGGTFNAAGTAVAATDHTIVLTDNVSVNATGGNQIVTLGNATAGSGLSLDLNGAIRTFDIAGSVAAGPVFSIDTLTLNNDLLGTTGAGITKIGLGTLILNGASSYTGVTTVTGGGLSVRNPAALGTTAGGTVVDSTGGNRGNLQIQGGITITGEALSLNGDGADQSLGTFRNISGNNTWTGDLTIGSATTTRLHSASGILTVSGNVAMSTNPAAQFVLQGDGGGVISGNLTGPSRLTRGSNGAGTWVLSGTNNYDGITTVSSGVLQFGKRVSLYNADTSKWTATNLVVGGGTMSFNLGGTGEFTSADILSLNSVIAFLPAGGARLGLDISNAGGSFTYSNVISNGTSSSIGFLKTGTGNLTLSANNTFLGTLGVSAGTLTLTGANAFTGLATASNSVINVQNNAALGTSAAGINVTGAAGQLQIQGGTSGLNIVGEALSIGTDADLGTGAVLNVSGNNTWTGNVTFTPSTANKVLRVSANSGSKLTFTGNVSIASSTEQVVLGQGDGIVEYTGVISGTGGKVTKSSGGNGTLILSGANTYTGVTQISGGTVLVGIDAPNGGTGVSGAFGNATSAVNITTTSLQGPKLLTNGAFTIGRNITTTAGGGGTLGVTLGGNAAATSSFTGSIAIGAGAPLTFSQVANGVVNISGAVTGAPNITIDGAGTVNFDTTAKAYTGTTTVNSLAKLLVNTTVASPTVTVNGTLGGSGTLSGIVNVTAAGVIAPGNSAGTLTTGALSLDSLSLLNYELATPGTVGMNVNDLLTVSGALNLNGTLNVTALGGFGAGTYRLIDYTGSFSGSGLTVGTLPLGYSAIVDTSVANQVNLVVSAIPEPSTFVLGAVGILGFAILRRRRAG